MIHFTFGAVFKKTFPSSRPTKNYFSIGCKIGIISLLLCIFLNLLPHIPNPFSTKCQNINVFCIVV